MTNNQKDLWFTLYLSTARVEKYLSAANGDIEKAKRIYGANIKISESFYPALHILELLLKNRIDATLVYYFGSHWWANEALTFTEGQKIGLNKVIENLKETQKPIHRGHLIADLSFSFWTSFFNSFHEELWQQCLHYMMNDYEKSYISRKDFSRSLTKIRSLRNRIMHYEPILHWKLPKVYSQILELISWLSEDALEWLEKNSEFPEKLALYEKEIALFAGEKK